MHCQQRCVLGRQSVVLQPLPFAGALVLRTPAESAASAAAQEPPKLVCHRVQSSPPFHVYEREHATCGAGTPGHGLGSLLSSSEYTHRAHCACCLVCAVPAGLLQRLLGCEGVKLEFTPEAIQEIAAMAEQINKEVRAGNVHVHVHVHGHVLPSGCSRASVYQPALRLAVPVHAAVRVLTPVDRRG